MPGAHVVHQPIETSVGQRVIDDMELRDIPLLAVTRTCQLPVAIMTEHENDAALLPGILLQDVLPLELHPLADLLGTDGQGFQGLQRKVTEPPVELRRDGLQLRFVLFRKAVPQIVHHHLLAIAQYLVDQDVDPVGEQVEQGEWQEGDAIDEGQCHEIP